MEFKPFDLYSDYRLSSFAATTATGMSALADKTMLSTATSWSGLRRPQQCAHLHSGAIGRTTGRAAPPGTCALTQSPL